MFSTVENYGWKLIVLYASEVVEGSRSLVLKSVIYVKGNKLHKEIHGIYY